MKYNAFISYRHTTLDMKVAKKLHKALETFRIPASVRKKTGKKRIERVFRDQEELPIGSDLNENILNALTESEFLIVVCSPNTPKSEWVAKEIETFIRLHDRNHVLAILIDSEPEDSFPKLLVTDEEGNNVEPLAADIRGASSRERDKKFKTELLRLVAPLIGCTYDDIRQRHKERIIKRNLTIGFSAAGIIVLLAVIFGIYNASVAGKMALLAEEKSQLADQVQEEARQRQISKSKYLAKLSLELWKNGKPKEAVATAVSSYEKNENGLPVSSDSSYALSKVLDIYSLNYFKLENSIPHDFIIENSFMTDDYSKMISIDISGTVYVWNPENLELLCKIEPYDYYSSDIVGVSADDTYIYICLYDEIKKYDYNGKFIKKADRFDRYINGCDFHVSDQLVVLNTPSEIILFNLDTFRISKKIETDYKLLKGISYSPADNIVCIGGVRSGDEGQIDGFVIINLDTEETIFSDLPFPFHLKKSTFNPDGDIILYYGFEGTVGTESVWMDENRIALYSKEGMFLWEQPIAHRPHGDMNHSDLFSYGLCQVNSETRYLVGVSIMNEILILDGISSEIIVEYPLSEKVTGLFVGNNAAIFTLADGSIHTLIYKSGYDNKLFESGIKNMQMFLCPKFATNGYSLVMQQENSSSLYSVAYQDTSAINNVELKGSFFDVSPTGNYFVFDEPLDVDTSTYRYYFYGSNGKLLDSYSAKGNLPYLFLEDTIIFVNDGELDYYNPIEKTKDTLSLKDLLGYTNNYQYTYYIEDNNPYLIGISADFKSLVIADIRNKKKVFEYEEENYLDMAAVSKTGEYVLIEKCALEENNVICYYSFINLNTGEEKVLGSVTPGSLYDLSFYDQYEIKPGVKVSSNGKYAALLCSDNILRLIDLENDILCSEIPVLSETKIYMDFTADNNCFIYQKEDYAIEFYDLNQQSVVNTVSADCKIKNRYYDEENGLMAFICYPESHLDKENSGLYLVGCSDYGLLIEIPHGYAYLPKSREIFVYNLGYDSYILYYKTAEEMVADAKKRFPDIELTEE